MVAETMDSNFITDIIDADLAEGRATEVHTRFPPEPNGYLHIGSAKAIYINSSVARKYNGKFNLRYDDTNPAKEDMEYVNSILEDLEWLGAEPTGGVFYGSDYFEACYKYAEKLIMDGKAYVCDLTKDQITEYRGTLAEPGRNSPYRNRTPEENLDLFHRMNSGEFPDGSKTLRAKIDMASPNMNMRDPVIYRIVKTDHHRQGDKWCIYPMYDFAHPIQDAIEGITHSLCSIEFENHRPLYDWVIENIGAEHRPHQYEFARLNVTYTVTSKRYLRYLVKSELVDGWDDPRMPTLCGLRRRGFTPSSIFEFVRRCGIAKAYSVADAELLDFCIREELNENAPRRVAVLDPVKVIIDNYPEGKCEYFSLPNHPAKPELGTRELPFTREIYIDREDFSENPPPKYFRLKPGGEVRLMGSYIIKYVSAEKNTDGSISAIHCTADLECGSGMPADGRKIKGTIHWLSEAGSVKATVKLYDRLFSEKYMVDVDTEEYDRYLNRNSVKRMDGALIEKSVSDDEECVRYQFVRCGYFVKDIRHPGEFIRIVSLKDGYRPE